MIEAAVADALVKQAKTQASAYEARLLNLEKDMFVPFFLFFFEK